MQSYGNNQQYNNIDTTPNYNKPKGIAKYKAKWQGLSRRDKTKVYAIAIACIVALVLVILFEVFKSDFERWVQPMTRWLRDRESWSWLLPVAILIVLSIPPLFGQEIVALVCGLTYPLGVAIGIVCLGTLLGEIVCFVLFKYVFTGYVDRKRAKSDKWEATARLCSQGGWRLVLLIRLSLLPPHLVNPLFATSGLSFFVYLVTVIITLPKQIAFVALGQPNQQNKGGTKTAKIIAIGILVIVSIIGTIYIRKRLSILLKQVKAERGHGSSAYDSTNYGKYGQNGQNSAQPQYTYPQQTSNTYQPQTYGSPQY